MSGPVTTSNDAPVGADGNAKETTFEITTSRKTGIGGVDVRRALPKRGRRTVGPWCLADHFGPNSVGQQGDLNVAPHPHIGLQTVTWLFSGELVHRDSLGSEQLIRRGELNVMTAGHGVAHSEERTNSEVHTLHGLQLWVAQPSSTRDEPAAFEHLVELPRLELEAAFATVIVGELGGATSPARRDTDHVGADLVVHGNGTTVPLRPDYEHALVVIDGVVGVEGAVVEPGQLAYLGLGRDECRFETSGRAHLFLVGGVPFEEPILMWWNFIARTQSEITTAYNDWAAADVRFGRVASNLARTEVDHPLWMTNWA